MLEEEKKTSRSRDNKTNGLTSQVWLVSQWWWGKKKRTVSQGLVNFKSILWLFFCNPNIFFKKIVLNYSFLSILKLF